MPGGGSHGSALTARAATTLSGRSLFLGTSSTRRRLFNAPSFPRFAGSSRLLQGGSNSGAGFSASRAYRGNSRVAGHERPSEPRQGGRQAVLGVAGQRMHLARQIALQGRLSERRGQGRGCP